MVIADVLFAQKIQMCKNHVKMPSTLAIHFDTNKVHQTSFCKRCCYSVFHQKSYYYYF